jgi:WD40 repeat protein
MRIVDPFFVLTNVAKTAFREPSIEKLQTHSSLLKPKTSKPKQLQEIFNNVQSIKPKCLPTRTGGWDKTLRYWDLRQQSPAHVQQLPEKCYAMSVSHPLLVVGCAERVIQIFNLANPQQVSFVLLGYY